MKIAALSAALLPAVVAATPLPAQISGPSTGGTVALEQERRMVGHHKRVLMIAAHPDDENTEVLAILARGHGAETAYLSLTRGEGGQNLLGPELGDGLGVLRTGELLAARAVDGARQYFTRAADYGFSKTMDEAWRHWPRDSVLKDAVRVIRRFRPQIIISVFTGTPADGHGHHQAAGWIAAEAYRVAGDAGAFPELEREEGLGPFTPAKLYRSSRFDPGAPMVELDGGRLDPAVGQSFRQLAMRSRSLHRSQDMGVLQEIGPSTARLQLVDDRTGAGAALWSGIDTTAVSGDADQARRRSRILAIENGVIFDAIASGDRLVAGQSFTLRLSVWNAGAAAVQATPRLTMPDPDRWRPVGDCLGRATVVEPNTAYHCHLELRVPEGALLSIPYFLEHPRRGGMYRWGGDLATRGEPFGPEPITAAFTVRTASGDTMVAPISATFRMRDQAVGEVRRPVQIVPRIGVRLEPSSGVWAVGGGPRQLVAVLQHGAPDTTTGTVQLEVPPGWTAPPPQPFRLLRQEETVRLAFTVTPPPEVAPGRYQLGAVVRTTEGEEFALGLHTVDYPHVTARLLPRPATIEVAVADLVLPAVGRVGYVRGAADQVPEVLRDAGVPVDLLDRGVFERGEFAAWDVIVIGSRAFETDTALLEHSDRLMDWVREGGRLVVQYQQQAYFGGGHPPFPMALAPRGHDRVTDEGAAVTMVWPDAPLLRRPNPITAADWEGWVQERGLYFPRTWASEWTPFLAMNDPGEAPLRGGVLAARVGAGTYLYTGLSFFRQLPAAVPGALRLFLNLLEYDHHPPTP